MYKYFIYYLYIGLGHLCEAKKRTGIFQTCTFSYMVLILAIAFLSLSQLRPTKIIRWLYPSRNVCATSQLQEKQRRESLRSRLVTSLSVVFTTHYNIANRAGKSNSAYVSVLQISLVHSDCASKSLCQKFSFARAAIVSVAKNIQIFRDNNG